MESIHKVKIQLFEKNLVKLTMSRDNYYDKEKTQWPVSGQKSGWPLHLAIQMYTLKSQLNMKSGRQRNH